MSREFVITGLDGVPIHDGDKVFAFAQNYKSTLIEGGDVPIYEEQHDKPLPVKDVPLFRGTVVWSEDQLAYQVKVSWACPQWRNPPSAIHMGGGHYAYQKTDE